jgi:hypothetical protein
MDIWPLFEQGGRKREKKMRIQLRSFFKSYSNAKCRWLTPIILATWEAGIRKRVKVRGQPWQIVLKTPF